MPIYSKTSATKIKPKSLKNRIFMEVFNKVYEDYRIESGYCLEK
ncbi:hypothetical protein QE422_000247 [Chryseobacterium sp. SORGH_AS 447]|nr:hypothetical protein [Chryseobacterium sp. SORGH_AS_0447]